MVKMEGQIFSFLKDEQNRIKPRMSYLLSVPIAGGPSFQVDDLVMKELVLYFQSFSM